MALTAAGNPLVHVPPATAVPEAGAHARSAGFIGRPRQRARGLAHGLVDDLGDKIRSQSLRPGDKLLLASAGATTDDALQDWSDALDGIKIEVDYLDIFGKTFHYARVISTKTP